MIMLPCPLKAVLNTLSPMTTVHAINRATMSLTQQKYTFLLDFSVKYAILPLTKLVLYGIIFVLYRTIRV